MIELQPECLLPSLCSVKSDEHLCDVFIMKPRLEDVQQLAGCRETVVVVEWRRSACLCVGER